MITLYHKTHMHNVRTVSETGNYIVANQTIVTHFKHRKRLYKSRLIQCFSYSEPAGILKTRRGSNITKSTFTSYCSCVSSNSLPLFKDSRQICVPGDPYGAEILKLFIVLGHVR